MSTATDSKSLTCTAFEYWHDVGLTIPWRNLNEHVNVIRQDLHLVNSPPIDFGALIQENKEPMGYSALQHPPVMYCNRDPDDVMSLLVLGVRPCAIPPCHSSSMTEPLAARSLVLPRNGLLKWYLRKWVGHVFQIPEHLPIPPPGIGQQPCLNLTHSRA